VQRQTWTAAVQAQARAQVRQDAGFKRCNKTPGAAEPEPYAICIEQVMATVFSQANRTQEAIQALEPSATGRCLLRVEGETSALAAYKRRITRFLQAVEAAVTDSTEFARAERLNLRLDDGLFEASSAAVDACFPPFGASTDSLS